jgi:hypothetical protein
MRIACVMMQKNEKDLLGPWVAYHGHLFGIENLYVYDNGSTEPDVVSLERRFENLGLNIDYSKSSAADFVNKGVILGEKIAALDASGLYDLFIPLDCDEFVVVSEDQKSHSCERADILKELERHINQSQVLAVGANLINVPGAPGYFCRWRYKKVFFAKGCFERIAAFMAASPARQTANIKPKSNMSICTIRNSGRCWRIQRKSSQNMSTSPTRQSFRITTETAGIW